MNALEHTKKAALCSLNCKFGLQQSGETITHTIANGGILRIVPPKKEEQKIAAAETKK